MTGPRSCRQCGAALNPDIRWCTRCYTPVTELAPRERQLPPPAGLQPIDPATVRKDRVWIRVQKGTYTRTRAGATSFGLAGRITLTALVLSAVVSGFFSMFVVYWIVLVTAGAYVIKDVWKREYVPAEPADPRRPPPTGQVEQLPEAARQRLGSPEPQAEPVRPRIPVWLKALRVLAVCGVFAFAVFWQMTNSSVHGVILICSSVGALVLYLRWAARGS